MTGGYSAYATTPSINYLKNTPNGNDLQHWAWLSLNITPTFLKRNINFIIAKNEF